MEREDLLDQVKRILIGAAAGLIEGSSKDLDKILGELADDLAKAALEGNEEALRLTIARIRLLGERERIRISVTAVNVLQDVMRAVFAILKGILLP